MVRCKAGVLWNMLGTILSVGRSVGNSAQQILLPVVLFKIDQMTSF
jgi:hypothetical protein